jgi:hypothetical protein
VAFGVASRHVGAQPVWPRKLSRKTENIEYLVLGIWICPRSEMDR